MNDFNRKVEEASARMNKSVAQATERLEKETAELITYLNDEVVPAVRQHSTKALRVAAESLPAWPIFWKPTRHLPSEGFAVRLHGALWPHYQFPAGARGHLLRAASASHRLRRKKTGARKCASATIH